MSRSDRFRKPDGHWLVKQEPEDYPWGVFVAENGCVWTGVRSFQARNNLRAMAKGDLVLYYHSGREKAVVGIAAVAKPAYPDPSDPTGEWICVDLKPLAPLPAPVSLKEIKAKTELADIALVRQSRLSVMPLTEAQFATITAMAERQ